jgi:hypothetical protein
MKTDYHERKQARLENAKRLSEKNAEDQNNFFKRSDELASVIPMGQPILVGHHSEKGHRAHLKKIHRLMDKGVEAGQKAKYYANKAEAIESNYAISSDDPDAIAKLEAKLKNLEESQEHFKACNKIIKSKKLTDEQKVAELTKHHLKETSAHKLLQPDFAGRLGYPAYMLQNNNANMTRIRQRIETLKKTESLEAKEEIVNGVRIVSNVEGNRVQIFFPGKPDEKIRKELKSSGFRWSPREGAWQRHLSPQAQRLAKEIVEKIKPSEEVF